MPTSGASMSMLFEQTSTWTSRFRLHRHAGSSPSPRPAGRCPCGAGAGNADARRPPRTHAAGPRRSDAPSALTVSTRPPAVTMAPSCRAVPAWNTSTPGRASASSNPLMTSPAGARGRVAPGGHHHAHRRRPPPTRPPPAAPRLGPPPTAGPAGRSAAGAAGPGSQGRRNGQLYSSTLGPSAVSMMPGVEHPAEVDAAPPQARPPWAGRRTRPRSSIEGGRSRWAPASSSPCPRCWVPGHRRRCACSPGRGPGGGR